MNSIAYMCHVSAMQSSVGGHLGWFRFLATVNSEARNTDAHVCL